MKKSRRKARELALKALYQWQLTANPVGDIAENLRDEEGFETVDDEYFLTLLKGVVTEADGLDGKLSEQLDRPLNELSPIEHAILLIGAYEGVHCLDVPYRVVINEAVELAKAYGGTDGHKYVNGVLDKLMADLRAAEVQAKSRKA
jgi:N utilization substance protein B